MPALIELPNGNEYHTEVGGYDQLFIGNPTDAQRVLASESECNFYLPPDHEAWDYLIKPDLLLNVKLSTYNSQTLMKMRSHNRKAGVFTVSPYYGRV